MPFIWGECIADSTHVLLWLSARELCNRTRHAVVFRGASDELGISITGGLEYGVPILISEIIPDQVIHKSGEFYVGDAILAVNGNDLRDKRHHEAAEILAVQQVFLQVSFYSARPKSIWGFQSNWSKIDARVHNWTLNEDSVALGCIQSFLKCNDYGNSINPI